MRLFPVPDPTSFRFTTWLIADNSFRFPRSSYQISQIGFSDDSCNETVEFDVYVLDCENAGFV